MYEHMQSTSLTTAIQACGPAAKTYNVLLRMVHPNDIWLVCHLKSDRRRTFKYILLNHSLYKPPERGDTASQC